jgi:hypothetical protein
MKFSYVVINSFNAAAMKAADSHFVAEALINEPSNTYSVRRALLKKYFLIGLSGTHWPSSMELRSREAPSVVFLPDRT